MTDTKITTALFKVSATDRQVHVLCKIFCVTTTIYNFKKCVLVVNMGQKFSSHTHTYIYIIPPTRRW